MNSGSESTIQGARIWLPNIDGFYFSFGRLLKGEERQRNTASHDSAEFLVAATRGNVIIIDTLTQKIEETFPNEVGEISDLDALVFIVNDSSFLDICTLLPFTLI